MIKRGPKKIQGNYGMPDYYKHYLKTADSPVSAAKFNKIVGDFNSRLIEGILNDNIEYTIPIIGFKISVRKDKRVPKIVNGKLYNTSPVDWVKTKKLWESNESAKENKTLVRYLNNHTSGYVFRIYMRKFGAKVKNKSYYKFKPSRLFQRALGDRINDDNKDKFECYLLYTDNKNAK